MALERNLRAPSISPLVREERNVAGQPGGGPLATRIPAEEARRFVTTGQEIADGAGTAVISMGKPNLGFAWLIERITVIGGGSANVYVGEILPGNLVDFTSNGTRDIADEFSPIYVSGGQQVYVEFLGAGANTACTARMQMRLMAEG